MDSLFQSICSVLHGIENYHDNQTAEHECRTGKLMFYLAKAYGLDHKTCELLNELGSIHDIGKIAIPEAILGKQGPLTRFERKVIELHPLIGEDLIKKVDHPHTELASTIILTHHENYDGSGYPRGLKGKEIPLEGSICSICDVYDALRESRPYRQRKTHQETIAMMYNLEPAGLYHKFDPILLKHFNEISPIVQKIYDTK